MFYIIIKWQWTEPRTTKCSTWFRSILHGLCMVQWFMCLLQSDLQLFRTQHLVSSFQWTLGTGTPSQSLSILQLASSGWLLRDIIYLLPLPEGILSDRWYKEGNEPTSTATPLPGHFRRQLGSKTCQVTTRASYCLSSSYLNSRVIENRINRVKENPIKQ